MNKKVAILQSNYIPWKGYFDLINMVDEFIIYDDMQYTKRDWRNRNKIKTPDGVKWISIPVEVKGKYYQKINETKISDVNWNKLHWQTIMHNYSKSKYFKEFKDEFEDIYLNINEHFLCNINFEFIKLVNKILNISTKITWSSDYKIVDGKTERLVNLCEQVNASEYISGPAAKNYIDEVVFKEKKIKLSWMDYSGYKEYNQLFPPFEHGVSIIDLIFNEGPNATKYMKSL